MGGGNVADCEGPQTLDGWWRPLVGDWKLREEKAVSSMSCWSTKMETDTVKGGFRNLPDAAD